MKIVVDDKIPYIREKLALLTSDVMYLRGAEITASDVKDADALIVRTRTHCNEQLLSGSKVQFVATATIGFDHIDTDYLKQAGIVAQYVECSLLQLQQYLGLHLQESTIGIVGCGHVGSKVKAVAERLGMHVLVCDPPLEKANPHYVSSITYVPLDIIERECDVITFHVPLTHEGPYATFHMADEDFFHRLPRVPYIINTSRGEVVDNIALLSALQEGRVKDAVIDVWENEPKLNETLLQRVFNEPKLNETLLQRVFIGTPHIAGYSADGKVNADNMVIDALCRHFRLPHPGKIVPPELPIDFQDTGSPLDYYNPMEDSRQLKNDASKFESLRNNYPLRREKLHS